MSKKKRATDDAKEDFLKIKGSLPRGWISLYLDKYGKNLRGAAGYNRGRTLENIRDGNTAPSRQELNEIMSLIDKPLST